MASFESFIKELNEAKITLKTEAEKLIQNLVVDIHSRLIDRPHRGGTPIDTRRASGSWGIDKDAAGSFELLLGRIQINKGNKK